MCKQNALNINLSRELAIYTGMYDKNEGFLFKNVYLRCLTNWIAHIVQPFQFRFIYPTL